MVLAGALQRNTWHFSMQVSLSLATKAKSLQGNRIPQPAIKQNMGEREDTGYGKKKETILDSAWNVGTIFAMRVDVAKPTQQMGKWQRHIT